MDEKDDQSVERDVSSQERNISQELSHELLSNDTAQIDSSTVVNKNNVEEIKEYENNEIQNEMDENNVNKDEKIVNTNELSKNTCSSDKPENISHFTDQKKNLDSENSYTEILLSDEQNLSNYKNELEEISYNDQILDNEEVELIVEEIIELEEQIEEPLMEICDEIETIEIIKQDEDDELLNEPKEFKDEKRIMHDESANSSPLKKQFQQYKTYENKKKKNLTLSNNVPNTIVQEAKDLKKDYCEDKSPIKEKNNGKSKVKIIKSQILNETIDIKNLLKIKKSDEDTIQSLENVCNNKFYHTKNNSDKDEAVIKNQTIDKPKVMEKVLWKNVSIGNEKKLIPISSAVKIVKIPKNAKVIKIQRSELANQSAQVVTQSGKNYDCNAITGIQLSSLKKQDDLKIPVYNQTKTPTFKREVLEIKNRFGTKNFKVYNSPKSSLKFKNINTSYKILNKNDQNINVPHQESEDHNLVQHQQYSTNEPDTETEMSSSKDLNSKIYSPNSPSENKKDVMLLQKRKRGRPPKNKNFYEEDSCLPPKKEIFNEYDEAPPKKKRGRPPRSISTIETPKTEASDDNSLKNLDSENFMSPPQIKKRGRPPKRNFTMSVEESDADLITEACPNPPIVEKKRRGRPSKKRETFYYEEIDENPKKDDSKLIKEDYTTDKDFTQDDDSQYIEKKRRGRLPKKRENFYYEEIDENEDYDERDFAIKKDTVKKEVSDTTNVPKKRRGRPPKKRENFYFETADSTNNEDLRTDSQNIKQEETDRLNNEQKDTDDKNVQQEKTINTKHEETDVSNSEKDEAGVINSSSKREKICTVDRENEVIDNNPKLKEEIDARNNIETDSSKSVDEHSLTDRGKVD